MIFTQGANACFSGAGVVVKRRMLANALSSKLTGISGVLGRFHIILGRELRRHVFWINEFIYSFSGSAERALTGPQASSSREKIALFSALANSIFQPGLCEAGPLSCEAPAAANAPLWLSGCRCPGSIRFLWFYYFFPQTICFFVYLCSSPQRYPFRFFLFFQFVPPSLISLYHHHLLLSSSTSMFWKVSLAFEQRGP